MQELQYSPMELLAISRPVQRRGYILKHCRDRDVLDLGCYDETALTKVGTDHWLHGALCREARSVLGIDLSDRIPTDGLKTGPTSRIIRGDVSRLDASLANNGIDVVVAGELIEHLPNALGFLCQLKQLFSGKEFIASTPNATSLYNTLLATTRRESSHHDHLQIYSYKTLSTLCRNAGFEEWAIVPYHAYFTEMELRTRGMGRWLIRGTERAINLAETIFPLLSGGLLLHVSKI
jgi:Methyltransferase domain